MRKSDKLNYGFLAAVFATLLVLSGCSLRAAKTESSSSAGGNVQVSASSDKKYYTLAEVSAHGERSDCWLAINGSVYDASQYINSHPGGPAAIINYCGRDATSVFEGNHSPEKTGAIMERLKIGTLN
jgi:cytochrome b involved in lipid metabolism